jgi:hypothetical protein
MDATLAAGGITGLVAAVRLARVTPARGAAATSWLLAAALLALLCLAVSLKTTFPWL